MIARIGVTTLCLVFLLLPAELAPLWEGKSGDGDKGSRLLDEQVLRLQEQLQKMLHRLRPNGGDYQRSLQLGLGLGSRMLTRHPASFEESARLDVKNGRLQAIRIYYEQTTLHDLKTVWRKMQNSNVPRRKTDHIQMETASRRIAVGSVSRKQRHKILRLYRDYLQRIWRKLHLQAGKSRAQKAERVDGLIEFAQPGKK